jgi:hypothetical protein
LPSMTSEPAANGTSSPVTLSSITNGTTATLLTSASSTSGPTEGPVISTSSGSGAIAYSQLITGR